MKVSVPEEYFPLFESIGRRMRVRAGEFVFCESDEANDIYLVIEGRVQVYLGSEDGRQTTLEVLKSGRIFGDASFLEHSVRRANIVAVVDTELISCRMDHHDAASDFNLQLSHAHNQPPGQPYGGAEGGGLFAVGNGRKDVIDSIYARGCG